MNKSFNAEGIQFAWDSTSIKLAETCLRKYQYKMIEGWQPKGKSVHLRFGGHYATALEHFYKHIALGLDREEALRLVVKEALVDTWDYPTCTDCNGSGEVTITVEEAAKRIGGVIAANITSARETCMTCGGEGHLPDGAPWDSGHNTKTRENLIRTIIWYVEHFAEDAAEVVILEGGKPAVEYSFTLPVDNGIILSGHIDRLVTYADAYYVMDQKTTQSSITPKFFEGFSPDTQMSLYTFAGKAIYDLPVKGVIIDAASILVGGSKFERGFTFRTDDMLTEWYDTAMWHIEQAQAATKAGYFPMNDTACGNYGGCEFRHICSRSPNARANFLKGDFTQGPSWDPLTRR